MNNMNILYILSFEIGIFFILPCIDSYDRVDLRTRTYDVPPQEVTLKKIVHASICFNFLYLNSLFVSKFTFE